MTASLSAVVLAHRDPQHVRRLIAALPEVPIALHCDVKTADQVAGEMVRGWGSRVTPMRRTSATLGSWSLVRVELDGLRTALETASTTHVAIMSGSDYPLVGQQTLLALLEGWLGASWITSAPIPFDGWDDGRHQDGGRWRIDHRFLTRGDDLLTVRGVPLRLPWRRRVPSGLQLRASTQWKVYAREDAERILRTVDERPDLVRFWRSTYIPEESFVPSVLASPDHAGAPALPDRYESAWLTYWAETSADHPYWLDDTYFDALAQARNAPPARPETGAPRGAEVQRWFARKFSTEVSTTLLDRIDAELW